MSSAPLPSPHDKSLRFKLCVMMFLQIFIWGAWFELGFDYIPKLKFSAWQNAMIFGAFNIGALVALFFSTQFADRKFAAEKFLGVQPRRRRSSRSSALFFLQAPVGTEHRRRATRRDPGGRGRSSPAGTASSRTDTCGRSRTSSRPTTRGRRPGGKGEIGQYFAATPEERDKKKLGEGLGNATKFWAVFDKRREGVRRGDPGTAGGEEAQRPAVRRHVRGHRRSRARDETTGRSPMRRLPLAPFWPFFLLMLLHCVFYVPTISITNSIAFANLKDPAREFGPVRVWGTIGWIVASWPFIFILVDWAKVPA